MIHSTTSMNDRVGLLLTTLVVILMSGCQNDTAEQSGDGQSFTAGHIPADALAIPPGTMLADEYVGHVPPGTVPIRTPTAPPVRPSTLPPDSSTEIHTSYPYVGGPAVDPAGVEQVPAGFAPAGVGSGIGPSYKTGRDGSLEVNFDTLNRGLDTIDASLESAAETGSRYPPSFGGGHSGSDSMPTSPAARRYLIRHYEQQIARLEQMQRNAMSMGDRTESPASRAGFQANIGSIQSEITRLRQKVIQLQQP